MANKYSSFQIESKCVLLNTVCLFLACPTLSEIYGSSPFSVWGRFSPEINWMINFPEIGKSSSSLSTSFDSLLSSSLSLSLSLSPLSSRNLLIVEKARLLNSELWTGAETLGSIVWVIDWCCCGRRVLSSIWGGIEIVGQGVEDEGRGNVLMLFVLDPGVVGVVGVDVGLVGPPLILLELETLLLTPVVVEVEDVGRPTPLVLIEGIWFISLLFVLPVGVVDGFVVPVEGLIDKLAAAFIVFVAILVIVDVGELVGEVEVVVEVEEGTGVTVEGIGDWVGIEVFVVRGFEILKLSLINNWASS